MNAAQVSKDCGGPAGREENCLPEGIQSRNNLRVSLVRLGLVKGGR